MTATPCPLCDATDARSALGPARDPVSGESFRAVRCGACDFVHTVPRPRDTGRYYAEGEYYAFVAERFTDFERLRLGVIARLAYRGLGSPGRLLDVGCGSGRLTAAFRRLGWTVHGLEPSPSGAELAARRGIPVHVGTLHDELPWDGFDAVVFNHSLEHVLDPVADLRRAAALLRPGGRVGLTVPNFASWQRRVFGTDWLQLDMPRHLNHFEPATLASALGRAGLDTARISTSTMAADLPASLASRFGLGGGGRLRRVAGTAALVPLFPVDRVLGADCLNAVAQKPTS